MLVKFGFSKTTAVIIHLAVAPLVIGYTAYHLLYGEFLIGVLALISFGALLLSSIGLYRNVDESRYTQLFVFWITTALLATCYYLGMRGLILVFPLISALFYAFGYRLAVTLSVAISVLALFFSLNVLDVVTVARTAMAMALTIIFSMSFLLLVTRQREEIEREAGEDYLTGVLNRRSFSEWLNREIPRAVEQGRDIALLYIDLDDFKRINDAYGHDTGDKLLQQVSQRIQASTRASDRVGDLNPESQLARLSGDEFSLVLLDVSGPKAVEAVIQRLMESLTEVFVIESIVLSVNASIGVAMTKTDGDSFESLLKSADAAMYQVKREGKKRYQFFNEEIAAEIREENEIEQALLYALETEDFDLLYMPIYHTDTLAVASVEVLLRSDNVELQRYGTERYIQVAEERGLIYNIDLMVLEKALQKMVAIKTIPVLSELPFCINISAKELLNPDFCSDFQCLLKKYPVNPAQIELEITETSLVASNAAGIAILEDLKSLGVTLSLDDFGTGYTAFNQLSAYPVDTLKIDKSFVDTISTNNASQQSMVNVVLTLAEIYGLSVVAEGVETTNQLLYLRKRNCDFVQGYLLSQPLAWDQFVEHAMSKLEYAEVTAHETGSKGAK